MRLTRSTLIRDVDNKSASIRSRSKVKILQKITIRIIIEKIISMKIRNTFDGQKSTRTSLFTRKKKTILIIKNAIQKQKKAKFILESKKTFIKSFI